MGTSAVLHNFKEKIEYAAAMVRSMDAEEKLQAVEHWNIVSEQLQIIVNHSADNLSVFAPPLDGDELPDFIDASQLVALGLAPALLGSFVSNSSLDASPEVLCKQPSKNVEEAVVIATPLSGPLSLPPIDCNGTVVVGAILNVPLGETDPCHGLPGNKLLNVPECEVSNIPSIVDCNLVDRGVLDNSVHSEALGIQGHIIEDGHLISPVILKNPDEVFTPTEKESKNSHISTRKIEKEKTWVNNENHQNERYYVCSYCSKTFITSSQLTTHTWSHTKPYVCSICHARFSTRGNLTVHTRRHSGERPYMCILCPASFSTRSNLLRHRKAHSGEKPWECALCTSRFTEKKSLKVHMRRHTGERPYRCTICPKAFTQPGILQSHLASHLDQREFSCSLCGKSFRQKSQLRLHERRHAGLTKFECSICPAKFHTKCDMERHNRVHTGERRYVCKLCQKSYTRRQFLNEHMNRHYGLKPYQCKYCDKEYVEMSACYKHIKTHERSANALPLEKALCDSSVAGVDDEDIGGIFEDSSGSIHRTDENTFFMEELI